MTPSDYFSQSAATIMAEKFPWQRYWLPRGIRAQRDSSGDGFFFEPAQTYSGQVNGEAIKTAALGIHRLLILHGEPAVGKTHAATQLAEASPVEPNAQKILVTCRSIDPSEGLRETLCRRAEWQQWQDGQGELLLVIDGIDEGIIALTNFVPALIDMIRGLQLAARRRLHLVLTCRTADWTPYESREKELLELLELDGSPRARPFAFELCPLTESDAKQAAVSLGLDATAFLTAVQTMNLRGLAAFPFTLKMLLVEFQQGSLRAKSRRELYDSFARKLCADAHDPERHANFGPRAVVSLSVDRVMHAASFIAASLITAGRRAVCSGQATPEGNDLTLDEISIWPPVGSNPTQNELVAALHTGIFACSAGRFTFLHQTMAECLAADLFRTRPLVQLSSLFLRHDSAGRHVVPQLAQTASWLSEQHSGFFDVLLADDPETLLRSDVRHLAPSQKERIVSVLLDRLVKGQSPPNAELHLAGLKCPDMAARLRPSLTATSLNFEATKFCIEIINRSDLREMEADLWALLSRPNVAAGLRVSAAVALKDMLSDTVPNALLRLLSPEILAHDEDDEIRGLALRTLVPKTLPVSEVFRYLTRPKTETIGLYRLFALHELVDLIGVEDVPAALRFLRTHDIDDEEPGYRDQRLMRGVLKTALGAIDRPGIAAELAEFWASLTENRLGRYSLGNDAAFARILRESPEKRACLREALLNMDELWAGDPEDRRISEVFSDWHASLLQGTDLDDLLVRWKTTDAPKEKQRIARVLRCGLRYGFNMVDGYKRSSGELLHFLLSDPACAALVDYWVRPWELDSPRAREARETAAEEKKWEKEVKKSRRSPDWTMELAHALSALDRHPSWFARAIEVLRFSPGWKHEPKDGQFRDLPGWDHLTPEQRSKVRSGAQKFVLECDPGDHTPGKLTNFDEAAYNAAVICLDLIPSDRELAAAIVKKWMPAIVWSYDSDHGAKAKVLEWAYCAAPDITRDLLVSKIRREATVDNGIIVATQFIGTCCDRQLAAVLFDLMTEPRVKPEAIKWLTLFLAKYDADFLLERICTPRFEPPAGMPPESWSSCLGHALHAAPAKFWPALRPWLEGDSVLARSVLTATASHQWHHEKMELASLSPFDLAAFFRLLTREFPIANDPPFRSGLQEPNPLRDISQLRGYVADGLGQLGTDDACDELWRLSNEFPDGRDALLWRYHSTRHQARLARWVAPTPREVAELLTRTDARLVRDAPELLDVVVESLNRFQRRLSASSNPRIFALWDIGGTPQNPIIRGPRAEEYLAIEIAAWLQDDLGVDQGDIINREVVPTVGQRTDVVVDAIPFDKSTERNPRVIIEVKGNWHAKVRTALKDQLVDLYLTKQEGAVGIYLVCWYGHEPRRVNHMASKTYAEAKAETSIWAEPYTGRGGYLVAPYVLNCELTFAPKKNSRRRPKG